MTLNIQKFTAIVAAAKAKAAGNPRWLTAISKAADAIINNTWIITELFDCYAITTESGRTYFANGKCQCEAYRRDTPCKHRSAARLLDIYKETATPAVSLAQDVAASSRKELIIEITNVWPKTWPPLYTELLARFGKSDLNQLDDDLLRRVRLAIAL